MCEVLHKACLKRQYGAFNPSSLCFALLDSSLDSTDVTNVSYSCSSGRFRPGRLMSVSYRLANIGGQRGAFEGAPQKTKAEVEILGSIFINNSLS